MAFHRYSQPSYPGFPSLAAPPGGVSFNGTTYDLINVIDAGTGSGGSAYTDSYKTTGPNAGTYLHAFGEDATSSNFNRGMKALAQNCDFLDDLLNRALSVPVRTGLTTAGAPVSSIVLPSGTFVGDTGGYPIEMLFNVVDDQDRAIITSGTRVQVSSITGASIGGGFSSSTITLNLNVAIPTSTQYRVFYGTRSKLATLPIDAFTFDRTYGLYADIIPYAGSGNWVNGSPLSATNVEQALDEIVSTLASTTNGSSGAQHIGYNGTGSLWKDGTALAATRVEDAIDELVTTLAGVASGTGQGASKIGLYASSFSGALTAIGGGGILTSDTKLADALTTINTRLVARRSYTAVFTDAATSVGGDYNASNSLNAIRNGAAWEGGTFFVRRGTYIMDAAITDLKISGEVLGEGWLDNTLGPAVLFTDLESGTSDIVLAARSGNTSVPPRYSRLLFSCFSGGIAHRYVLGEQSADRPICFDSCLFPVGQTQIADGARLRNCIVDGDAGSPNNESIYITANKDVVLDGIKCIVNPASAGGGVASSAIVRMSGGVNTGATHKFPIAIRNSYFATAGGRVLVIDTSSAETLYEDCTFHGTGTGAEYVAYLSAAQNVTFRRCTFIQDAAGKTCVSVNNCGNILFEDCVVWGTSGTGDVHDIEVVGNTTGQKPRSVRFVNTTLRVRKYVTNYVQHKWYVADVSRGSLVNCEIVLDFSDAQHGPLANFNCSVDGLRVDLAGKVYQGSNTVYPFELRNESTGTVGAGAVYSRVQLTNVSPPATNGSFPGMVLVQGGSVLHNACITLDTTATVGSYSYTLGAIVVGSTSRVLGGDFVFGNGSTFLAWGRIFYQELHSTIQSADITALIDATTMLDGCVSYLSDTNCIFSGNRVSLTPEAALSILTLGAVTLADGKNRQTVIGNYIDVLGTDATNYMHGISLGTSNNMLVCDNILHFTTAGTAVVGILGANNGGANRGLVKDNVVLNLGTGVPTVSVDAGITSTPNVTNASS